MFEPISARFASSFSRNGIKLAATDTNCFGLTSMYSTSSRCFRTKLPACRASTKSSTMRPALSMATLACAIDTCLLPKPIGNRNGLRFGVLLVGSESRIGLVDIRPRNHLAHFEVGVARVQDLDFVD